MDGLFAVHIAIIAICLETRQAHFPQTQLVPPTNSKQISDTIAVNSLSKLALWKGREGFYFYFQVQFYKTRCFYYKDINFMIIIV